MAEYWDNDILAYRRTKVISSEEQKSIKILAKSIIDALSESFNADTSDVSWAKSVIDNCVNPVANDNTGLTTVIYRMEQYLAEHPMNKGSVLAYKQPTRGIERLLCHCCPGSENGNITR